MALTLTSNLTVALSYTQTDTQQSNTRISDNGALNYATGFTAGTGYGQVNTLFSDVRTIASGSGSQQLDLTALPRELFGSSYDVTFSGGTIKALVIRNNAPATGVSGVYTGRDLRISTTGANGWATPFGGATGILVKPQSPYVICDRAEGFAVNASNRIIDLIDVAGVGLTYEIAIVGVVI